MFSDWIILLFLSTVVLLSLAVADALKRRGTPLWLARKFLHATAISACALAPLLIGHTEWLGVAVWLIGILLAFLIHRYDIFEEVEGRKNYGIALFTLPYGAMLMIGHSEVYCALAMFILAFSDSLACTVGKNYPIKLWHKKDSRKSIGGSLTFFVMSVICVVLFKQVYPDDFSQLTLLAVLLFAAWITLTELMGEEGWDNVWVPLFAFVLLPYFAQQDTLIAILWISAAGLLFIWFSAQFNILRWRAGLAACFLALTTTLILDAFWLMPLVLFLFSSWVIGKLFPARVSSDIKAGKARDEWQVWSNGGAWLIALCLYEWNAIDLFQLKLVCLILMATATADTWSSQIGTFFRHATWDILRWGKCPAGLSGGISLPGSAGGLAGSLIISLLGFLLIEQFSAADALVVSAYGFGGMLLDSVFGSAFQATFHNDEQGMSDQGHKLVNGFHFMTNDRVNFFSQMTLLALCLLII